MRNFAIAAMLLLAACGAEPADERVPPVTCSAVQAPCPTTTGD